MAGTTTHGLPYPTGTDLVRDGDDAIQALAAAVDGAIYAGTGIPNGVGLWSNFAGCVVCTDLSLAAQAGSTVTNARWSKIGTTVNFQGTATSGSAAAICAITLPNALAGTPLNRMFNIGTFVATGAAAPTQAGVAFMHANLDRIIVVTYANGFVSCPAGSGLRWAVTYETAT